MSTYPCLDISSHASPRIGAAQLHPAISQPQTILTVPKDFNRPLNHAQTYAEIDTIEVNNSNELLDGIPHTPAVLKPHDVTTANGSDSRSQVTSAPRSLVT